MTWRNRPCMIWRRFCGRCRRGLQQRQFPRRSTLVATTAADSVHTDAFRLPEQHRSATPSPSGNVGFQGRSLLTASICFEKEKMGQTSTPNKDKVKGQNNTDGWSFNEMMVRFPMRCKNSFWSAWESTKFERAEKRSHSFQQMLQFICQWTPWKKVSFLCLTPPPLVSLHIDEELFSFLAKDSLSFSSHCFSRLRNTQSVVLQVHKRWNG